MSIDGSRNAVEAIRPLDDRAGLRRALSHDANNVERQQTRDNRIDVRDMIVENRNAGPTVENGPIRHRESNVVIVI
jgi:hypothetical protein